MLIGTAIAVAMGVLGYYKGWLTLDGAVSAVIVGMGLLTSGWALIGMTIAFFVLGSKTTKYKASIKVQYSARYY